MDKMAIRAIAQADEDCEHQLLQHTHFENLGALEVSRGKGSLPDYTWYFLTGSDAQSQRNNSSEVPV